MSKLKKITQTPLAWVCLAVIFGALFWLGDMYYDFVLTPKAASAYCGKGNIELVSMKGFYTRDIVCFSELDMPN